MTDLTKILLTASLTSAGGVLAFVFGQFVLRFVIEPVFSLRAVVAECGHVLFVYANVLTNGGQTVDLDRSGEATAQLREKASLLRARAATIPGYGALAFLGFIPQRNATLNASRRLVFLSNSVGCGKPEEKWCVPWLVERGRSLTP